MCSRAQCKAGVTPYERCSCAGQSNHPHKITWRCSAKECCDDTLAAPCNRFGSHLDCTCVPYLPGCSTTRLPPARLRPDHHPVVPAPAARAATHLNGRRRGLQRPALAAVGPGTQRREGGAADGGGAVGRRGRAVGPQPHVPHSRQPLSRVGLQCLGWNGRTRRAGR